MAIASIEDFDVCEMKINFFFADAILVCSVGVPMAAERTGNVGVPKAAERTGNGEWG